MIQHDLLQLENVYAMLTPEDDTIIDSAKKEMSEAVEFVRKMNVVSTKDKEKTPSAAEGVEEMDVDQVPEEV